MTALCFSSADGAVCQVALGTPRLPASIEEQLSEEQAVRFECEHMDFELGSAEAADPHTTPLFFEWQQLDWLFEPGEGTCSGTPPFRLYVNGSLEKRVQCRQLGGRYRLTGSISLGNAVGLTDFEIRDAKGQNLFRLGVEVFPQKLDYKDDFSAMMAEITEIVYSLAFDLFKKTYATTQPRTTYRQTISEWLNLYRVLADRFEKSIDTILRTPKSTLKKEARLKPVERVKRVDSRAVAKVHKNPSRYCRGGGYEVAPGIKVSHLEEQHKKLSYDTKENRFVLWAINSVIKQLDRVTTLLTAQAKKLPEQAGDEVALLKSYQRRLRFRLNDQVLAEVGRFDHQQQFSTTLTMAPGYKEFYHWFLLLRKGLTLADNSLFKMDYKDIATLYEYWCFLKTVKLLRDNPKYDLTCNDIVKLEHQRFCVALKKGRPSGVHFKQLSTGDEISLFYNREFSKDQYTHTFKQVPDNFIEFSRSGFGSAKDRKSFKVVFDAKYRFDRGSEEYPGSAIKYGPPLDTIAQLHRYRDAILWQEDADDSVKVANKSLGGVILFPYPDDEAQFRAHPFYQSIDRVNIGAIPLQPGKHRENRLYKGYLDSLFERSGEVIHERRIQFDNRQYREKKQSINDLVMVGLVPRKHRDQRLDYHFGKNIFYTKWARGGKYPLDKVKIVALYDQVTKSIVGYAEVLDIDLMLGSELEQTGTQWSPSRPNDKHLVYRLGDIKRTTLPCSRQMQGHMNGRFFVNKLGLDLALEQKVPELLYMNTWQRYQEWKALTIKHENFTVRRKPGVDADGNDMSEVIFDVDNSRMEACL